MSDQRQRPSGGKTTIQNMLIDEIQELKLAGYTVKEVHEKLEGRYTKVSTIKTVRKRCNMDVPSADNHAKVKKQMAFDVEPFRSAIMEIAGANPGCFMSPTYDVLAERLVETGEFESLPGNEQTLRNYIHHLKDAGEIAAVGTNRRTCDVVDAPPAGKKAQVDFGQQRCEGGLVARFMCILL